MLSQLLITLLVIGFAYVLLKRRRTPAPTTTIHYDERPIWRRYIFALIFGLLSVVIVSYSGWYWYDNHRIVTVTIMSMNDDQTRVYQARKGDISDNKMVTLDGLHVRFSTADRLEITPQE